MDGLGPALFGLFLVSFTVSKPVSPYHPLTLSSSESSESNESSSEEIIVPRETIQPTALNTVTPGALHHTIDHTAHPDLAPVTSYPAMIEQDVVEVNVNTSQAPLPPAASVTARPDSQRVVFPDFTTPELRCYTVPITSPEAKPARGDDI